MWHRGCETTVGSVPVWHGGCETTVGTVPVWHGGCETTVGIVPVWHRGCETTVGSVPVWHGGCETTVGSVPVWHGGCETTVGSVPVWHGAEKDITQRTKRHKLLKPADSRISPPRCSSRCESGQFLQHCVVRGCDKEESVLFPHRQWLQCPLDLAAAAGREIGHTRAAAVKHVA